MTLAKEKYLDLEISEPLCPAGLSPYPFQISAMKFSLARKKTYLALDPGLGKTIVAALIVNQLPRDTDILFIGPPFLEANVHAEFQKWSYNTNLIYWSDSMLKGKSITKHWNVNRIAFVDEAHRFKNPKAQRSGHLFRLLREFDHIVFLSGTPMPNSKPIELWPILELAAPGIFGRDFFHFAKTFCGAKQKVIGRRNGKLKYAWDFGGFTNRDDFARRISPFMLRVRKNVLNLPPKREGLLTVGDNMPAMISKLEKNILAHYTHMDLLKNEIAFNQHLSTYLHTLGKYKLKYVLPYIESLLEDGDEKLLIFGIHKDTIAGLVEALKEWSPLVITGDTPKNDRNEIVKQFQKGSTRLLIGNIQACGIGFTMTQATRVIFVEFSWVDGDNEQASDRAHRIGQNQSVLVQYVVLKDSIDRKRMEVLLNKRRLAL